ncbi:MULTISPECIES: hypothetical protein [unclassified Streptomyces]|uniref:hypothetical protein n=1 Tax=unclassified Streptomyces TaxID=2593676 RepID=UPI00093D54F6|nr:hypothetical protein [Streptomyces sp. CB02400]OKJ99208.1 hypothetical protein AMK33_28780 [Streptomyces sp. CB02400]
MESTPSLRLLPWSSSDGKPCFLANGVEGGRVSQLADETEARQLADGLEMLGRARRVLDEPLSPNVEVRYTAVRLTECLADALRVAESRGRRLSSSDARGTGSVVDSGTGGACS